MATSAPLHRHSSSAFLSQRERLELVREARTDETWSALAGDQERLAYLARFAERAPTWRANATSRPTFRFVENDFANGVEIVRARNDDASPRERAIAAGAALFHLRLALEAFGEHFMIEELAHEDTDTFARVLLAGRTDPSAIALRTLSAALRRTPAHEPFPHVMPPAGSAKALANECRRERVGFRVVVGDERDSLAAVAAAVPANASTNVGALVKDAPLVCVVTTRGDGQADWLAAGRALAAVYARATERDLAVTLMPEIIDDVAARNALGALVKSEGVPQLAFRLGPC